MEYVTEFEICALMFLLVVTVRFFTMRKFPSLTNKIFGFVLYCAIIDIALDIIGSYTVFYADSIPIWVNYAVNNLFYVLQVCFPAFMFSYVLCLSKKRTKTKWWFALIPAVICLLIVVSNPLTKWVFYIERAADGVTTFGHGLLFPAIYICSGLYMILNMIYVTIYRSSLMRVELLTIYAFEVIVIVAMLVQFFFPHLLLIGVAISLAILMMFFTIQNPEIMLDAASGVFNQTAANLFIQSHISNKHALLIAIIDIGGVRNANSSYGLRFGNAILEQVGKFFTATCGKSAFAFRMVGTKFIIISEDLVEQQRIIAAISERFKTEWNYDNLSIRLIVTIRYCEKAHLFTVPDDVINLIDVAFSGTSNGDYGTCNPISEESFERSQRILHIENALRQALIKKSGFNIVLQPLYHIESRSFKSAEVLLRFTDPILGSIPPAEFIPIAEKRGLIFDIDRLVLDMAYNFLTAHPNLKDVGLDMLEINLSAVEFNHNADAFAEEIISKFATFERNICFEVTETAANLHTDILYGFMNKLIERGFSFAIDDFGTGYANIKQLINLPISIVKLDRAYIACEKQKDYIILSDLIRMVSNVGLLSVVEGVETSEQADRVISMGINRIQGFFYSPPIEPSEFVRFCTSKTNTAISPE